MLAAPRAPGFNPGVSVWRFITTLIGGVVGGALVALVWVHQPTARAAEAMPRLSSAMRPGARATAALRATLDESDDIEVRKRPTPMEPVEAARAITIAWKDAHGAAPSLEVISVLWAEWALETGRGRWMVDHNFAGLTGRGPEGGSALWWSFEQTKAGRRRVRSRFRAYPSFDSGARDYVAMVSRHPEALAAARLGDAERFVAALDGKEAFGQKSGAHRREVARLAREFSTSDLAKRFAD